MPAKTPGNLQHCFNLSGEIVLNMFGWKICETRIIQWATIYYEYPLAITHKKIQTEWISTNASPICRISPKEPSNWFAKLIRNFLMCQWSFYEIESDPKPRPNKWICYPPKVISMYLKVHLKLDFLWNLQQRNFFHAKVFIVVFHG